MGFFDRYAPCRHVPGHPFPHDDKFGKLAVDFSNRIPADIVNAIESFPADKFMPDQKTITVRDGKRGVLEWELLAYPDKMLCLRYRRGSNEDLPYESETALDLTELKYNPVKSDFKILGISHRIIKSIYDKCIKNRSDIESVDVVCLDQSTSLKKSNSLKRYTIKLTAYMNIVPATDPKAGFRNL